MARIRQFGAGSLPILVAVTLCFFSQLCSSAVHGDHSRLNAETMQNIGGATGQGGFRVDLVRMDSHQMTKTERIRRAIERSRSRVDMFLSKPQSDLKDIDTPVSWGKGEFLMQIAIGTPLLTFDAIMDTGSDLVWTQCKPCDKCYKQKGEIFDPSKSSTYEPIPCSSSLCKALKSECAPDCEYQPYVYGYNSFTKGVLAYETFTFATTKGRNTAIPRVAFGCGRDNGGEFNQAGGLVGMGRGNLSLISQLGPKANNKFSYCLVSVYDPATKTSPLLFGNSADLRGPGVKSTQLVQNKANPSFYYLSLEGLSVGGSRIDFPAGTVDLQADGSGGFVIDSGSTITSLEQTAYDLVKRAVQENVKLEQTVDRSGLGLDVCYKVPSDMSDVKLPAITFHFAGGADFDLPDENSFYLDGESRVLCLAMQGSEGISIFGNIQQQNFHRLYDLGLGRLSFVQTTCDSL